VGRRALRLVAVDVVHGAVGHAVHRPRSRGGVGRARAAPTARCAPTTSASRGAGLADAARFFNTGAFVIPAPGTFGNAGATPSSGRPDTAQRLAGRDVRLTGTQVLSLRLEGTNLLNSVRFGAIDTAVNSPTFGQVISIQPMRTLQFNARYRF
jgi:hypothetical protein